MDKWINLVRVGYAGGSFGESECKITYFHGQVVQVNHSNTPITHISGGGGNIHGYYGGRIDPIQSHTEIRTDFKMWVRSKDNKDFSWSSNWPLNVASGQKLTLIFLNGNMVAYVNHNTNDWKYVKSDSEIAEIAGQQGYLVSNNEELKKAEEIHSNGMGAGFMSGTFLFLTSLFVESCNFWGWRWIEEPSSILWYFLPVIFLILGALGMGRKFEFWFSFLLSMGIGFGSWFFGYERWGAVFALFIMFSLAYQPPKKYSLYVNNSAISKVKDAIFNNANYAMRNFGSR